MTIKPTDFYKAIKESYAKEAALPGGELLSLQCLMEAEFEPLGKAVQVSLNMSAPHLFEMQRSDLMKLGASNLTPYQAYMLGASMSSRLLEEIEEAHAEKIQSLIKK